METNFMCLIQKEAWATVIVYITSSCVVYVNSYCQAAESDSAGHYYLNYRTNGQGRCQ